MAQKLFFNLAIFSLVIYGLVIAREILVPIVIAFFIWYLIVAISDNIEKRLKIKGKLGYFLSISSLILISYFPISLASGAIPQVMAEAPKYQENLNIIIANALSNFDLERDVVVEAMNEYVSLPSLAGAAAQLLASFTGSALMIIIYVAFILLDQSSYPQKLRAIFLDENSQERAKSVIHNISEKIKTYIWVKTLMSFFTALFSYIVLFIVGVDFAAFWAVIIFFLNYIPNVGSILGVVFPALLSLVQFDNLTPFLIVITTCGAIQFTIGNIIEPKLMGDSLNLSAFVIIVSLVIWGSIWGLVGAFLSVPITVIMMIVFAEFPATRKYAIIISGDGKI